MWRIFLFGSISILIVGCENPLPNPESLDAIYLDLSKQLSTAEGDFASAQADLDSAKKELAAALPQTGQRKRALLAIDNATHALTLVAQKKLYLELRKEKRLQEDHKTYLKAFKEKKPWPNSDEIRQYEVERRLVMAPRIWDQRVPKSQEVLAHQKSTAAPPKEAAGEHE